MHMQISETPFMTCRIVAFICACLHVLYSLNMHWNRSVCDSVWWEGGSWQTHFEYRKGQWNTKNILQLCRCSHVFLRNSQWQSFANFTFLKNSKAGCTESQAVKSPSSSWSPPLFATSTSDDVSWSPRKFPSLKTLAQVRKEGLNHVEENASQKRNVEIDDEKWT